MTTPITLADITIYPIVEQQGFFFKALEFFPMLTKVTLDENRSWLQPSFIDADGGVVLCIQGFAIKTRHHTILVTDVVAGRKDQRHPVVDFSHQFQARYSPAGQGTALQRAIRRSAAIVLTPALCGLAPSRPADMIFAKDSRSR
jgi:hypothetical protein